MFVAQAVLIDVDFEVAWPWLVHLVTNGELDVASQAADRDGLTALMRVEPTRRRARHGQAAPTA
jgi:hypothetical protein